MNTFLIILIILFIFANYIVFVTLKKTLAVKKNVFTDYAAISVIVAAKNEGQNIPSLLKALSSQNYPADKYEVIIVDDNSEDNTYSVAKESAKQHPAYSIYKAESKKYAGKKGALEYGISKANYTNILITDADCQPSGEWIAYFAGKFSEGYDIVFGYAPFFMNNSLINHISCFENLRAAFLTFTAAETGFPYSAAARSFGFKKLSFEKIEGYKNTTETLGGDDDLLIREAVKNKMKIGTVMSKEAFVYSNSVNSLKDYLRQKSRHTKTSVHYLLSRQVMLAIWHGLNLFFLLSPLLAFIYPGFVSLFITKLILDFVLVSSFSGKFAYCFRVFERVYLQFIYEFFIIINFFNAAVSKDKW